MPTSLPQISAGESCPSFRTATDPQPCLRSDVECSTFSTWPCTVSMCLLCDAWHDFKFAVLRASSRSNLEGP